MALCIPVTESGCWLWISTINIGGYGTIRVKGTNVPAHRLSHELFKGPIPDGFEIDHLCRVRCCVNPDHIEAVTPRENLRRSTNFIAANMAKTHCPRGHEYTPENTYQYDKRPHRICKACEKIRASTDKAKARARESQRRYYLKKFGPQKARLSPDQVRAIRVRLASGQRDQEIAPDFHVSAGAIALIRRGLSWKNIP